MSARGDQTRIHVAFRFHTNFYHSYRGDTPDELGFGKDIRIIRRIIEVLDRFNAEGVPARGTWDIENYFSLEKIMPEHCPDIIESLRRRVADGRDEVQVMSYNNGIISAHTAREFDDAIGRAIANSNGSGLKDMFERFGAMVRPQEMMYTPIHLKMYPAHEIESVSLFYSAVPFNAFSNFVKPLPLEQRYNPLTLTYPGIEETMTLVPAYNHGDIADNISLKHWLNRLRRKQLAMSEPRDLLLLIDADADDDYWYGYNWPVINKVFAAAQGIEGLIESIRDIDFVKFATPGEYVSTHEPAGAITIGQDTADGSFDGLSSWAEKWSNHQIWTGIERSRILELQTRRLMELVESKQTRGEAEKLIADSYELRLKTFSTTHFGLASPVMNVTRLKGGADLVRDSVGRIARAYDIVADAVCGSGAGTAGSVIDFALLDYVRGVSTETIQYTGKPSRALVRVPLSIPASQVAGLRLLEGETERPSATRCLTCEDADGGAEVLFIETMEAGQRKKLRIDLSGTPPENFYIEKPASAAAGVLQNEFITLRFDGLMHPVGFACGGIELADRILLRSAVNYDDRVEEAPRWSVVESAMLGNGLVAFEKLSTEIPLEADGEKRVFIEREFLLASGLPYLYITTRVVYPATRSRNYNKKRAQRLERDYDNNWREVMPCEIRPALFGKKGRPLRVWKHNYCDHMSCYDLNYAEFSKNIEIDSFNNHVTHAWVALSDGEKGLLVAQTADTVCSFAFCPMRLRATADGDRVFMNPFGSYHGKQLHYVTRYTGFGRYISLKMADQLDPYAPSYNGRSESFSLMLAPYSGDQPPEEIRRDAEAFAYPYAIASNSKILAAPPHRKWSFEI